VSERQEPRWNRKKKMGLRGVLLFRLGPVVVEKYNLRKKTPLNVGLNIVGRCKGKEKGKGDINSLASSIRGKRFLYHDGKETF